MVEPNISGSPGGEQGAVPISSSFKFNVPGLGQTTGEIRALNTAIGELKGTLKEIGSQQAMLTQGLNNIFETISTGSASATRALNLGLGLGAGGGGGGGSTPSGIPFNFSMPEGGGSNALVSLGQSIVGDTSIAGMLGRLLTGGLNYAYNRFEEARYNAPQIASALGPISTYSNKSIVDLIHLLQERTPVKGDLGNVLSALATGGSMGYGDLTSGRSGAFFESVRQMQSFTPGVGAGQLSQMFGGFLRNTGGHQRALMLTGGAMSGFGAGGVPKTLQEWAESTLKWFESQRPGSQRGKKFTREELITQQFPGSNMDAWFTVNGVPEYMREYFWQYVIAKANTGSADFNQMLSGQGGMGQRGQDLAWERLRTQTAQSRREFQMLGGSSTYEDFANREGMDRRFEEMMGQADKYMSGLLGTLGGSIISSIPTPIANVLAPLFIQGLPNVLSSIGSIFFGGGGLGDPQPRRRARIGDPRRRRGVKIGDTYGPYGGTGFAGMDPSFANRLSAMMEDNPNITITSGFRDGALQGRLHSAGVGMVAPAGQSMHGRGLAADLGPESEFDWIVNNAHRYGLESGVNFGEPWHVGMPGTVSALGSAIGDPSEDKGGGGGGFPFLDRLIGGGINIASNLVQGDLLGAAGAVVGTGMDVAGGIVESIPGLSGLIDLLSSFVNAAKGVFNFMGSAVQGIASAMTGDFSALFGSGGLFDPGKLMKTAASGIEKLTGLPLSGLLKGGDASIDAFAGWLGGSAKEGGVMKPGVVSSVNWDEQPAAPAAGGGGAGGVNWTGGSTGPVNVQSILQRMGGGGRAANVAGKEAAIAETLRAAALAGFKGDSLIIATALAGAESGWNPRAHNPKPPDNSYGLWQINMINSLGPARRKQFGLASNEELFDPVKNAKAAFSISKGGTDFRPWSTWPSAGAKYVQPVYNIAKQHGFVGDPRRRAAVGDVASMAQYTPQMSSPTTVSAVHSPSTTATITASPVSIQNTFHLDVRGGEADARRVAYVVADHIKDTFQEFEYLES